MMTATYTAKGGDGGRVETGELHWLNIQIDGREQQGRMPQTVCNIEVSDPSCRKGLSARFFVVVGINSNGKPFASLTGLRPNTESHAKASASWMDFRARAEARIGGAL